MRQLLLLVYTIQVRIEGIDCRLVLDRGNRRHGGHDRHHRRYLCGLRHCGLLGLLFFVFATLYLRARDSKGPCHVSYRILDECDLSAINQLI